MFLKGIRMNSNLKNIRIIKRRIKKEELKPGIKVLLYPNKDYYELVDIKWLTPNEYNLYKQSFYTIEAVNEETGYVSYQERNFMSNHHYTWIEDGRVHIIETIMEYKDHQTLTLYDCNDILKSQGKEEIELSINNLEKDMEGLDEDVVPVALGDDEVIVKKESLRALSQLMLDYRNKIMKKDLDLEYIECQLTLEIKALKDVIKNLKNMNKGLMERNNFIEHNKMLERLGLDMIE